MWSTGQAWRVVNSLNKLNEQLRAYAPRSVPPATDPNAWGSLADSAHSTSSDHYPHFYPVLGSTAVVCARDFPNAPGLGLDGNVVTEHMRQARDARIGYIIFNRRITGPNHGWIWQAYDGPDPHDTHFHVSSVHTAIADSTAAWSLPGGSITPPAVHIGGQDMLLLQTPGDSHVYLVGAGGKLWIDDPSWLSAFTAATGLKVLQRPQDDIDAMVSVLKAPMATIDVNALAAALAPLLGDSVSEADVVAALQSPAGQAALVQAGNVTEDS